MPQQPDDRLPPAPAALVHGLAALDTVARLLHCADPAAWGSAARPDAAGLAALLFAVSGEIAGAVGEIAELPDDLRTP